MSSFYAMHKSPRTYIRTRITWGRSTPHAVAWQPNRSPLSLSLSLVADSRPNAPFARGLKKARDNGAVRLFVPGHREKGGRENERVGAAGSDPRNFRVGGSEVRDVCVCVRADCTRRERERERSDRSGGLSVVDELLCIFNEGAFGRRECYGCVIAMRMEGP